MHQNTHKFQVHDAECFKSGCRLANVVIPVHSVDIFSPCSQQCLQFCKYTLRSLGSHKRPPLHKLYVPHSKGILFDLHKSLHSTIYPLDTDRVLQSQILPCAIQGKGCTVVGLKSQAAFQWQVVLLDTHKKLLLTIR